MTLVFHGNHEGEAVFPLNEMYVPPYFLCSPWDWSQIGIKLETRYVIYHKLENVLQKKDIYVNRRESVIFSNVNVYITGQNIMQRGDSMELNFEVLEI